MKGGHQRDALTFSDDLRRNASKATGRIKFKEELLALFSLLLWTGAEPRGGHPTAGGGAQFDKRPYTSTLLHRK